MRKMQGFVMSNSNKYDTAFIETFQVDAQQLSGLQYQDIKEWDSIGHMQLMSVLEEAFSVELDIDDIIDFSSYEKGKEILSKYGVSMANE